MITKHLSSQLDRWDGKSPMVLLLHGYGSHEHDLVDLMPELPGNLPWVSLRAPLDANYGGYSWFPLASPGIPNPPDVELATERIWNWIDANLPSEAKFLPIGFSQGGIMASQLLRTRAQRITATAILAGFLLQVSQPEDQALIQKKPKVFYARGENDNVIAPVAVDRTLEWLKSHAHSEIHSYPRLGHSIDNRVLGDLSNFVNSVLPNAK